MARSAVLRVDILADGSKAQAAFAATERGVGRLGRAMALGAAAAAVAVGSLAVAAVKSASSLEQATGAAQAIYGRYSGDVIRKSEEAARAVGLSASAYLDLSNVLGAQLKNAGTPMDQLAGKTDKLVSLGADLAAQFGGSTSDAVAAVSSLLKGERDPIERYGVSIKQADVNAKLAALGLTGLTGAAAKQAEAQATLALLTEQTASAQGAFGRESGTVANTQQKLGAIWENLKATLGTALLPVLVVLGNVLLNTVAPAASRLAAQLGPILGPIMARLGAILSGTLIPALTSAARAAGPVLLPILRQVGAFVFGTMLPTLARLAVALGRAVGPALLAVAGFVGRVVIPAFMAVWRFIATKIIPVLISSLGPALRGITSAFKTVSAAVERNRPALNALFRAIGTVVSFIVGKAAPVIGKVLGVAFTVVGKAIGRQVDMLGAFIGAVQRAVEWVGRLIDKLKDSRVGKVLGKAGSGIGGLFGSAGAASSAVAARRPSTSGLTAAGGRGLAAGLLPSVTVEGGSVRVFIGERELTDLVDVRVERHTARLGRRLASGVR